MIVSCLILLIIWNALKSNVSSFAGNLVFDSHKFTSSLVTWKRPLRTRFLLIVVALSSIALAFTPTGILAKSIVLYIGIEFFVLQGLRSHYPRHRRLFNALNLLLWGIPNDAEYAFEVVRLSGNSNKTGNTTATTAVHRVIDREVPRPAVKKTSVSMSDLNASTSQNTDVSTESSKESPEPQPFHERAAHTATTLAMLAAAAAVNKVKKSMDTKLNKKIVDPKEKNQEEQPKVPADEDVEGKLINALLKTHLINFKVAFGCMYNGNIPGRIVLQENGFIFQTTRMTGSKVLVECAFTDIIGVKKTKQYDVVVWHASGIDISISDGSVLHFENVMKRDECFNRLVSASDEDGGHWKKM